MRTLCGHDQPTRTRFITEVIAVEPGQKDYRVGDSLRIKISARYYFGQPVAGAEVFVDAVRRLAEDAGQPC